MRRKFSALSSIGLAMGLVLGAVALAPPSQAAPISVTCGGFDAPTINAQGNETIQFTVITNCTNGIDIAASNEPVTATLNNVSVLTDGSLITPVNNSDLLAVTVGHTGQDYTFFINFDGNVATINVSSAPPTPALRPDFGTATSTVGGFTVDITNYDSNYDFTVAFSGQIPPATIAAVTLGTASGNTLPITVTGLNPGDSATIEVTTELNSVTASETIMGSAIPAFGSISSGNGTAMVQWSGFPTATNYALIRLYDPSDPNIFFTVPVDNTNTDSGTFIISEGIALLHTSPLLAGTYDIVLLDWQRNPTVTPYPEVARENGVNIAAPPNPGPNPPAPAPAPPAPAPAPSAPAVPSAATPPVVTPAPQPVSTLPSGEAVAQVGGEPLAVTTSPVAPPAAPGVGGSGNGTGGLVPNGVTVSGGGVQMTASGPSVAGNFSGTGVSVPAAGPMTLNAAGFTAESPVAVYLIVEGQDPILLESATVNANGELASQVQIPGDVRPGPAVIQIDGINASNQSLGISLGIEVQDAVAPQTRASGNLPAPAPGRAVALNAEGRPLPGGSVRVGNGVVRVNADGTTTVIRTIRSAGVSAPARAGLIVGEDGFVRVTGSGFAPNSRLSVWGFSTPVLIGLVSTDAEGRYDATLPLAGLLGAGKHTFQVTGIDRRGDSVSLSAGLRVLAEGSGTAAGAGSVSTTAKPAKAQTRVTFARLSTTVTSSDRAALRALVNRVGVENIVSTKVTGYVQKSDDTSNDVTLSRARAKSTAAELRSLGVKGKITVAGMGVLNSTSSKARSAVVTFTYQG